MKKSLLGFLVILGLSLQLPAALAHEQEVLGSIIGNQTELKFMDHAFSGSVKNNLVMGIVEEDQPNSELMIKAPGITLQKARFGKQNNYWGGAFEYLDDADITHKVMVELINVTPSEQSMVIKINQEEVKVQITADDFKQNHFINPVYTFNSKILPYQFKLTGKACYRLSAHLVTMLAAAFNF